MTDFTYSEKVMEHFKDPRNVGEVANPDGTGEYGSPVCGDTMRVTIRVVDGKLAEVKWRTLGCGAAIASSSAMSEMATGMTVAEAESLSREQVAGVLGGLPEAKLHCSNLAADALRAAIADYRSRHPAEG